jgi:hypothetical protein
LRKLDDASQRQQQAEGRGALSHELGAFAQRLSGESGTLAFADSWEDEKGTYLGLRAQLPLSEAPPRE